MDAKGQSSLRQYVFGMVVSTYMGMICTPSRILIVKELRCYLFGMHEKLVVRILA